MAESRELHNLAIQAVRRFDAQLLQDRNVTAVGVGRKEVDGKDTGEPAVVLFVARKVARNLLPPSALLPTRLSIAGEDLLTDVREGGPFYQHANTSRIRPARPGTSLGEISITAGTFGAVVIDNKSKDALILSNNHVLANNNQAAIGSPIVQPGPFDGGTDPKDTIAKLLRFVPISATQDNLVDAAVAAPLKADLIENNPLNGVPAPNQKNPAIGILWGGDGATFTNVCTIQNVLSLLGVTLPNPSSTAVARVGDKVEKTGRTTEKTTGQVTTVNTTIPIFIPVIGNVTFKEQIVTSKISEGGDSGSMVVKS